MKPNLWPVLHPLPVLARRAPDSQVAQLLGLPGPGRQLQGLQPEPPLPGQRPGHPQVRRSGPQRLQEPVSEQLPAPHLRQAPVRRLPQVLVLLVLLVLLVPWQVQAPG